MIAHVLCRIYLIFRCDETTGSRDDSWGLLGRNAVHSEIVVISGYVARWSPSRTKLRKLWMLFDCMPATPHNRQLPRPWALHVSDIRVKPMHIERKLWKCTCAELQTGRINSRSVIHAVTNMIVWERHVSFKANMVV